MLATMLEAVPRMRLDLTDRRKFLRFLQLQYGVMVASGQLLRVALQQAYRYDTFVRKYYERHEVEERDHGEWARMDLLAAGGDPQIVDLELAALVGTQYYLIYHVDPVMLLGYMAALEIRRTPLEVVEALEETYGHALCRMLRLHAVEDEAHGRDLEAVVEALPTASKPGVYLNMMGTAKFMNDYLTRRVA